MLVTNTTAQHYWFGPLHLLGGNGQTLTVDDTSDTSLYLTDDAVADAINTTSTTRARSPSPRRRRRSRVRPASRRFCTEMARRKDSCTHRRDLCICAEMAQARTASTP